MTDAPTVRYIGPLAGKPTVLLHGDDVTPSREVEIGRDADPLEVTVAQAAQLIATGEFELVDGDADAVTAAGAAQVPDKVDDIKLWVGDDPERAATALAAEEARSSPRKTLVDFLSAITTTDPEA